MRRHFPGWKCSQQPGSKVFDQLLKVAPYIVILRGLLGSLSRLRAPPVRHHGLACPRDHSVLRLRPAAKAIKHFYLLKELMMSDVLSRFDTWVNEGGPSALVMKEYLEPAGGEGDVIFPPTFAPPEDK